MAPSGPDVLTITVNNKTDIVQPFQIFNAPPDPSGEPGTVYFNTWGTAPEVDAGTGSATFTITTQFYAICGNAPAPLAKGLTISTENFEAATLSTTNVPGSDWHLDIPKEQAPIFIPPDLADSKAEGGFTINTLLEKWVPDDYPNRYCGIGRDSPLQGSSDVVPVAVFAPDPNQTYNMTPKRTFWIAYGSTTDGLAVDITDLSTPVTIDFTGRDETKAEVDLQDDFQWGPVKFSP